MRSALTLLAAASFCVGAYGADADGLARGAEIYQRCVACHSFAVNRTGPKHCQLLNRKAGSVVGYDYSIAMQMSGISWSIESLDQFLADPPGVVDGTTMTFAGIEQEQNRQDLIEYLVEVSAKGEACEPPRDD